MLSIYNYKDPVSFLSSYIDHQKTLEPSFSMRKWAHSLGLNSSQPLLEVLKGKKKLKGKLLTLIISSLSIDKSEVMYFQAICERARVDSEEKQLMYDLLIQELKPHKSTSYSCYREQEIDLYSHWIYMAILSMTKLDNFHLTPENIKNKLRHKLDTKKVEEALLALLSAGLLKKNSQGKLERCFQSYANKTDVKVQGVDKYLDLVCDLAKKSYQMPTEQREIQCFSMAMSDKKLALAKEILRKTRHQLAALADEEDEEKNTIYQTNLFMFPLTE